MRKLLFANVYRLFHSKIYWLGMAFMLGFGAFAVAMRYRDTLIDPEHAYTTADGLVFLGGMYISIVLAVFISMFIGAEYSDGTMRNKLVVGHTRGAVYLVNLIVTVAASLSMHLIYFAAVLAGNAWLLSPLETPTRVLSVFFCCSLVTVVAMAALFQLLAMLIHSKATGAVVSMIVALVLIFGAMTIGSKLQAPAFYDGYDVSKETGELIVVEDIPNPKYLNGTEREIYQFLWNFLPSGQMMQFGTYDTLPQHVEKFPLYSLAFTMVSCAAGVVLFRRKDLK